MKALSQYLTDRGLLLGVYTDIGNTSCAAGPGSYGHCKGALISHTAGSER